MLWRLQYKLSLCDLVEMFALRGFVFTHEAVRDWEAKLAPHVTEELRKARRGRIGRSWYADETYLRVAGRWCYLYRAITQTGRCRAQRNPRSGGGRGLLRLRAGRHRDDAAAGDGHNAYPGAIRTKLGERVRYRASRYLNNHLEQDHRGIKGRYRSMRGFKSVRSAHRFCRAYDEMRHFLRSPSPRGRRLSLGDRH